MGGSPRSVAAGGQLAGLAGRDTDARLEQPGAQQVEPVPGTTSPTLGRAGLLCHHPRARSQHSPHPPPQRTRRARRWCSPREEGPPSLRPQPPTAQQRAFFPVFGGRQSRLLAGVCPPRFCLQLCPLAQPDYLTMVEVPGPPQRLHPPPPPTAAPGPGGRVLRVRLGSQAGCGFQNSICSV